VGSSDSDREFQAHQLAEHFSSLDDRDTLLPGGDDLAVVIADSRRNYYDIGVTNIVGVVRRMNLNTQICQITGDIGRYGVGA